MAAPHGRLPNTKHKLRSRPVSLSSFTVVTPPLSFWSSSVGLESGEWCRCRSLSFTPPASLRSHGSRPRPTHHSIITINYLREKVMKIFCFNPKQIMCVCVCAHSLMSSSCVFVCYVWLFPLRFVSLFKCSHRLSVDVNQMCLCSAIQLCLFTIVCKLIWPTF